MANSFEYICDFNEGFAAVKKEEKELDMSLATFSSAFRRLRKRKGLDSLKEQTKKQVESKGE